MIASLAVLLLCQLAGEIIARGLALPAPGPVVGAGLFFCLLALRDAMGPQAPKAWRNEALANTSRGLLANLSLLFVPAGVGVVQRLDVFQKHGVGLVVALVISTVLTLAATALTFVLVARLVGDDDRSAPAPEGNGDV